MGRLIRRGSMVKIKKLEKYPEVSGKTLRVGGCERVGMLWVETRGGDYFITRSDIERVVRS